MGKLFVSIIVAISLIACSGLAKREDSKPVEVEVFTVDSLSNYGGMHYVGNIEPRRDARLSSRHAGRIAEVFVRQGAMVNEGQVLVRVESQQIAAANDAAEASLRQAEDGLRRVQQVHQSGSVADVKMVEIETKAAQARATVAASRKSLDECIVRAPFSGMVAAIPAEKGVETGIVEELVRIVDMSEVYVEIAVPEREINDVKIGDRACVVVPAIDKRMSAEVTEKNMVGSDISHSYKCRLRLLQAVDGLMPGMISRVYMISDMESRRIVIPADIIRMDSEGKYVWVVDANDVVKKRRVVLGGFVGKGAEVVEGLSHGDRVVTKGTLKVSNGTKVRIKD